MSAIPQRRNYARLGKFFTGEKERHVPTLVVEWHTIRERPPPSHPTNVQPERLIHPCAAHVEGLMAESLQHAQQLRFSPLTGHSSYQTTETGHGRFRLAQAGWIPRSRRWNPQVEKSLES